MKEQFENWGPWHEQCLLPFPSLTLNPIDNSYLPNTPKKRRRGETMEWAPQIRHHYTLSFSLYKMSTCGLDGFWLVGQNLGKASCFIFAFVLGYFKLASVPRGKHAPLTGQEIEDIFVVS